MIVVDTNILAYLLIPGDYTARAEALLEREPEWVAPPLWRSELNNVLAAHLRRGLISLTNAVAVARQAKAVLKDENHDVPALSVLQLVQSSDCSAYDCEFVALAQTLGTRLVTMDKKILAQFPLVAISLNDWAH
jgi:predicted nucleic acid-binding protein